ncbi:LamG-like jellyroll fold domain-containing protein [Haladaptatus sp. R4]|uniref:LamG-like jellyroll fold domain-containing protein n=1 Tax=Haladaptatus sp. R4 TaxID=1679489 RepID=UPI000AA6306A
MDPSDPDVVYACFHRDGYRGLKRLETDTGGRTWAARDVATRSAGTVLRPVVPSNAAAEVPVLWLAGTYRNMRSSGTVLRGLPGDGIDETFDENGGIVGIEGKVLVGDGTRGVSLGPHQFRNRVFQDGVSVSALVSPSDPATEGVVANLGGAIRLGFSRETEGGIEFALSDGGDERTARWEWDGGGVRHFVEGKWDGAEMRLLIDGETVDTRPFEGPIEFGTEPADWTLLRDAYLMGSGFRGRVEEVRLYDRCPSVAESRRLAELAQETGSGR